MRRWLFLLAVLTVVFVLAKLNSPVGRKRWPLLKRIDRLLNIAMWVILAAWAFWLIRWLLTDILR